MTAGSFHIIDFKIWDLKFLNHIHFIVGMYKHSKHSFEVRVAKRKLHKILKYQ
jgi:hypothetical protein